MNSRDAILGAVRRNQPAPHPLPPAPAFPLVRKDLEAAFAEAVGRSGGAVRPADRPVADLVAAWFPDAAVVASADVAIARTLGPASLDLDSVDAPHRLADLDVLVCRAVLGVAENGAVWLPESKLGHRAAPFIAQHLVVLLDAAALVGTMHDAYARLDMAEEGFGVFVAGPSKTADIEQSLVIGAHGPRSFTVALLGSQAAPFEPIQGSAP